MAVPLTKARKEYAEARGGAVFYGDPLTYPASVEARYRVTLERAIAVMLRATEAQIEALWTGPAAKASPAVPTPGGTGDALSMETQAKVLLAALQRRFFPFFDNLATPTATEFMKGVDAHSRGNLHKSLQAVSGGLSLKTSLVTQKALEITKAAITGNVGLIKSIPREYFQRIEQSVYRSITTGQGAKTVLDTVRAIGHSTEKRAQLIARDQTSKVTSSLNAARMEGLGIRKFQWLHSRGGKVPRPLHIGPLNGQVFELAQPPIIDEKTGERGLPGQLINCRCRMVPVVDFSDPAAAPPPGSKPIATPLPVAKRPARRRSVTPAPASPLTVNDTIERETLLYLGKRDGVEFLSGRDATGAQVIAPYRGSKSFVGFTDEVLRLLNDPAQKLTMYHNHPSSSSLSAQDLLELTRKPGLFKLWAFGHNGSSYAAMKGRKTFTVDLHQRFTEAMRPFFQDKLNKGEISFDDVKVYNHIVNMELAKREYFVYEYKLSPEYEAAMQRLEPFLPDARKRLQWFD